MFDYHSQEVIAKHPIELNLQSSEFYQPRASISASSEVKKTIFDADIL